MAWTKNYEVFLQRPYIRCLELHITHENITKQEIGHLHIIGDQPRLEKHENILSISSSICLIINNRKEHSFNRRIAIKNQLEL